MMPTEPADATCSNLQVAVVIVGYRNPHDIARCLAALEKSTYSNFQVIVCENGGEAAFAALQSMVPTRLIGGQKVMLIKASQNLGYARGVNIAMAQSRFADAWWILNPDTEPSSGAMAALVTRIAQGCDAVSGPIRFPTGEIQCFGGIWQSWRARAVVMGYREPGTTEPDVELIERTQNFLHGASMFVNRTFAAAAGPMDERYFLYCEEVDWFLRAAQRGIRLGFAPDALVTHYMGTTTGYTKSLRERSGRSVWLDERNKMLLTRTFFPRRLPIAATVALFRLVWVYSRRRAFQQAAFGIAGWFVGLLGRSGVPHWARERK